jgi:hypothetical protein
MKTIDAFHHPKYLLVWFALGIFLTAAIFSAGCTMAGTGNSAGTTQDSTPGSGPGSYGYILEGGWGSWSQLADGTFLLEIRNVKPYAVYFSESPAKENGTIPLDRFIAGMPWSSAAPNAAVVMYDELVNTRIIIVQLKDPVYIADTATLTFRAQQTGIPAETGISETAKGTDVVTKFGQVTVSIVSDVSPAASGQPAA